ncbi:MAG: penicillin-binding transpeptidase domain-containing protein [Planctomycetota bacterium]
MRRVLRRVIPSMFHRRLTLLGLMAFVLLAGLGLKTATLTTGNSHHERRAKAERPLQDTSYIPTVRGRILDRTGVVLAVDEPGWNVEVEYRALTQQWVQDMAEAAARVELGAAWRELGIAEKDAAIGEHVGRYSQVAEAAWQTLADLGDTQGSELEGVRTSIVQRTERVAALVTEANRRNRMAELQEDVSVADAYMEIREQRASHAVLFDVAETSIGVLGDLIAEAERDAPGWRRPTTRGYRVTAAPPPSAFWLEVKPVRAKHRRYPLETVTLQVDRSSFPEPLASDEPATLTVPGVAMHVLGQLRPIYATDPLWEQRPFLRELPSGELVDELGGYRAGDRIGAFGVERAAEMTLRGSRGRKVIRLDADETVAEVPPVAGRDVTLTIDHRLQARAQAILSHDDQVGLMQIHPWLGAPMPTGTKLNGAAVVMDLKTGEVLAAVSVPGLTLHDLTRRRVEVFNDFTFEPTIFRATAKPYAPGSTAKPLILAAAIAEGIHGPDAMIDCSRGYLYENRPTIFRDWIFRLDPNRNFGEINGVTAIKVSSNVFFGVLGQRLRPERVHGWFNAFGAGRRLGLNMDERAGQLFDPQGSNAVSEANMACIGQGEIDMTPLQVLNAYATLFRGGEVIRPSFVRGEPQRRSRLPIPDSAIRVVREGMWKSANEGRNGDAASGTTYRLNLREYGPLRPIFNTPGVTVYAKSGSAQCSPTVERFDTDGDGLADTSGEIVQQGAHAWVVALAKPDGESDPTIGVAVIVEHGWSGGATAGPIANQLIRACQVEGYLPTPEGSD